MKINIVVMAGVLFALHLNGSSLPQQTPGMEPLKEVNATLQEAPHPVVPQMVSSAAKISLDGNLPIVQQAPHAAAAPSSNQTVKNTPRAAVLAWIAAGGVVHHEPPLALTNSSHNVANGSDDESDNESDDQSKSNTNSRSNSDEDEDEDNSDEDNSNPRERNYWDYRSGRLP